MKKCVLTLGFILFLAAVSFGQKDIRAVDFKNFTYLAHCIAETPAKVTVKDGEYSEEKQQDGYVDRFHFTVFDIAYGDLNADRRDEAVILSVCNTGGTGNFSEGFVYSLKAGKPTLLARIPGGDRAYGGLRSATIENGLLVVESNDVGTEGAACCPQIVVTTRYRLTGGRIVATGKASRREIYPRERVTFARGATGKTLKVRIPANEGLRYIVGARAGQSLTVSADSDKVSFRLLEGAEVKFGTKEFLAKLPTNGNYTVEVQNDSDTDLEVTINIKIN